MCDGAGVCNAPHYVLYSSMRRQKPSRRRGSELNCCKIQPLGENDIIYWSHITGVKVLVIAERGLLLVTMIAANVGGRDTERKREMRSPEPPVCSSNSMVTPSCHNPGPTENTAFLCSWCRLHLDTKERLSLRRIHKASHTDLHVYVSDYLRGLVPLLDSKAAATQGYTKYEESDIKRHRLLPSKGALWWIYNFIYFLCIKKIKSLE